VCGGHHQLFSDVMEKARYRQQNSRSIEMLVVKRLLLTGGCEQEVSFFKAFEDEKKQCTYFLLFL
jgi:hypothetical protein